jgi:hypothetical protein
MTGMYYTEAFRVKIFAQHELISGAISCCISQTSHNWHKYLIYSVKIMMKHAANRPYFLELIFLQARLKRLKIRPV